MNDQKPPGQDGDDAQSRRRPPQGSKPLDSPAAKPSTAQQLTNVEKQMTGFERATLRWARLAVLISGLAALFVCAQWVEMRNGAGDTHNLAVAAGAQATATQTLADRMKDQADETKIIANQAIIQAKAGKRLAQSAIETLSSTQKAFQEEQRAWIGVQGTSEGKGFTKTESWQVTVLFFNSGRTPARNAEVSLRYITSPVPLSGPPQSEIDKLTLRPIQSIAPQGYYREAIGEEFSGEMTDYLQTTGTQVLVSQYNLIKDKHLFLYYYGILKYDDAFGRTHRTQYCIFLANPDTKQAAFCDTFNDLD